ncbi:uncharacterized protein LOC130994090 [Salvia miltiorrhiza]|uniref:uncharacterized protein LOC130994090 n=1 Tax=Salvia miltiorrhiza TaxID=226208 RepID=UPI0025ABF38B|nr:uncharacterized protein LOC130994090 [Salvia miltiorrhiza]
MIKFGLLWHKISLYASLLWHKISFCGIKFGLKLNISLLWKIWDYCNQATFNEVVYHQRTISSFLKVVFKEVDSNFAKLGTTNNSWFDYLILRRIGVETRAAPPPSMIEVHWWPPVGPWMKVNTDGSALGAPGSIAAGRVYRDHRGWVRGCFHFKRGLGFAFETELLAVIYVITIAHHKDWRHLWLEADLAYVVRLLNSHSLDIPWRFLASWKWTLRLLQDLRLQVSHIYREGNNVADLMVNRDCSEGWWPYALDEIKHAVALDMSTYSIIRIKY